MTLCIYYILTWVYKRKPLPRKRASPERVKIGVHFNGLRNFSLKFFNYAASALTSVHTHLTKLLY